jgi:pimeloyl-ACP methyl ester carboxylesterase
MGAVYRARDRVLGRDVALKLLLAAHADSTVDRFRREVVALASVSHANIVSVHDAGVDRDQPYVVLELVEGQTLRERLRAGPLGVTGTARLARDLVQGLGAAHAVGVVHRDLKPENVLLDGAGTAKIVDFGLALLVERDDAPAHGATESGVLLGTPHYMAPEQVRGERIDHRADIFALGAVLYEALTGERAFDAPSRAEVITAVLRDPPAHDAALLPDEPARRLLHVIFRCLEKTAAQRYGSHTELLEALEAASSGTGPARPASERAGNGGADFEVPETRYATSSGVHIAYQVVSPPGPPTLIAAPPFISNIEVIWEYPAARTWIRELAAFSHYIHYDKRGVGMSDPIAPEATLDERVEDLRSVLDAEGVERAVLMGVSEGGPISIAFAARYPERASGLILIGSFARLVSGDGYAPGLARPGYDGLIDAWVGRWGTPRTLSMPLFTASRVEDPAFVRWANRYERQCASPGTVRRLIHMQLDIDVRSLLPRLRCPTLVMHRRDDPCITLDHCLYLARHIPGSRYEELEGIDHAPWEGDPTRLLTLTREHLEDVARRQRAA